MRFTGPDRDNRVYAAHVLIRAAIAQDIYTMERVMARWAARRSDQGL